MKSVIKYIAVPAVVFGLTACNDVFDELAVNPQQPSMGQYFTTPAAVNEAVMTCYGYNRPSAASEHRPPRP